MLQPFGKVEARAYTFDGFEEQNAGGIGLAVAKRSRTVFSPEAGLRLGGAFGSVRPFAEVSYVFQGNIRSDRDVAYLGSTAASLERTFQCRGDRPPRGCFGGAGATVAPPGASGSAAAGAGRCIVMTPAPPPDRPSCSPRIRPT